jgi:hypothetical protein
VSPDVVAAPSGEGPGRLHGLVDRLAAECADGGREEISAAREDYFVRSGKVFEDDRELYEARAASFLEWYVLERPSADGKPPVVKALERAVAAGEPPETRRALAALATSHRSLFDLCEVRGDRIELEDVFGGGRFAVHERRSTVGFGVGDLVEARLFWEGRRVIFGKTFLYHPRDAREEALGAVKTAVARGDSRDEILFSLARLHVRWHRHGHVAAARVYRGG